MKLVYQTFSGSEYRISGVKSVGSFATGELIYKKDGHIESCGIIGRDIETFKILEENKQNEE